jgi:simple sugar transport system ATP-binding protein
MLRVDGLHAYYGRAHILADVGFEVAAGEVLGVAGVAGNGQRALAEALAGVVVPDAGDATLDGRGLLRRAGGRGLDPRVAYIPEQPIDNGVAAALSATVNVALRRLRGLRAFPDWRAEAGAARELMQRFDVRPPDPRLAASAFSGGNLQKLVLARELSGAPDLIIACYPTMGLDVAATHAVHGQLVACAARGASVVWFSEDLDELLRFAHRIAVMRDGRIVGVLAREGATRQALGRLMAGATGGLAESGGAAGSSGAAGLSGAAGSAGAAGSGGATGPSGAAGSGGAAGSSGAARSAAGAANGSAA